MAIGMLQEVDQGTTDFYDQVNAVLQVDENPPAGLIVHTAAAKEGGGMRIMDVWESREAYDRFAEERLRPAMREVAGDQPMDGPEPEVFELHHMVRG